ncbi:MAG: hypothetical protein LQ337_002418 [Flavoplaca oasis]|nr:MAG: hypothetical protein LQ337_002418 [Flavoplaca oasis]
MANSSMENLNRSSEVMSKPSPSYESTRTTSIRRWDGARRTTTNWDSIRRDPELWFSSGDCLVHFYAQGHSRRGASLRVSLAAIESSNCGPLLQNYSAKVNAESPSTASDNSSNSDQDYFNDPSPPAKHELFIPAPSGLSREASFRFHVTTRNFFAWMFEKPLVGDRLGDSLLSLLDRMNDFREDEDENLEDVLAYLDSQEYTDFRSCPDHAIAVLQFAERHELLDLWRDSFCHGAGMGDELQSSVEYEDLSRQTQALITRAHMEMSLRLEHAGHSLGNFLEDDLSGAYLGLAAPARAHLDRFRSFLQSFYVAKYGYWPPTRTNTTSAAFSKATFKSMYFEFRNLYEYLVDPMSSPELQSNRPADGGICVFQNVTAFDKRRRYVSLPHPLPLLPKVPVQAGRPNTVRKLFKHSNAMKAERRATALAAVSAATNRGDIRILECNLVREYLRFEKSWTLLEKDESVSCSDARKVRWILIYAILQTLISVTRAPPEVRDTEGVSYPLCCQIAGTPPWDEDGRKAAQKKITLKQKLVALGEKDMRKAKAQQDEQRVHVRSDNDIPQLPPLRIPTSKVDFTTPFLEIKPDHADLFIPKASPLFSTSFPHPPSHLPPPPSSSKTSPTRPRALSLPRKISIGRELSVRSPQPQRPGFLDSLINYSRDHPSNPSSTTSSPTRSPQKSRKNSAPLSGHSSPGGGSSSSRRNRNGSPISSNNIKLNTTTTATSPSSSGIATSEERCNSNSNSNSSSFFSSDGENSSVSDDASVSSCYDDEDVIVLLDGVDAPEDISSATCGFDMLHWSKGRAGAGDVDGAVGKEKGKEPKRWDSVKSVGTLRRSNPEVDEYVSWGVAR